MEYFSVQRWMVQELKLRGAERDVFAIIYGFSQDGESNYHGSLAQMSDMTGYSRNAICAALKNLVDKNLINKSEKEINNVKFCRYNVNLYAVQSACTPIQATCTNNNKIINNNINLPDNNSKELLPVNTPEPELEFNFGKQRPKKENLYSQCISLIMAKTNNKQLRTLLINWYHMLLEKYKDRNKILYANIFKSKLNMLDKYNEQDWVEIIEYNLQRGYEGFYPIRANNNHTGDVRNTIEQLPPSEVMTDEDWKKLEQITEERRKNGLRTEF